MLSRLGVEEQARLRRVGEGQPVSVLLVIRGAVGAEGGAAKAGVPVDPGDVAGAEGEEGRGEEGRPFGLKAPAARARDDDVRGAGVEVPVEDGLAMRAVAAPAVAGDRPGAADDLEILPLVGPDLVAPGVAGSVRLGKEEIGFVELRAPEARIGASG